MQINLDTVLHICYYCESEEVECIKSVNKTLNKVIVQNYDKILKAKININDIDVHDHNNDLYLLYNKYRVDRSSKLYYKSDKKQFVVDTDVSNITFIHSDVFYSKEKSIYKFSISRHSFASSFKLIATFEHNIASLAVYGFYLFVLLDKMEVERLDVRDKSIKPMCILAHDDYLCRSYRYKDKKLSFKSCVTINNDRHAELQFEDYKLIFYN